MTAPVPLAEVTRRDEVTGAARVESAHVGHVVVATPERVVALGDAGRPTFARSSVKAWQATACLEVLASEAPGVLDDLDDALVAVAWASHRAEDRHLAAVRRLCALANVAPDDLTCPPDDREAAPGAAPARINHNCSGKHALFALAGRALGESGDRLVARDGRLQRRVLAVLAEALGPASSVAIDGCGAPAVEVPLDRLAAAFRDLASSPRWARVVAAGLGHPLLVGGEGRLESMLLTAGMPAKVGAEGVYGAAVRRDDGAWLGIAVKAEDGGVRAASAALVGVLTALGAVPAEFGWRQDVLGGGRPVGEVRAARGLTDRLASALA